MACDRAPDRALLLSLGLFGAPAGQAQRDREALRLEKDQRSAALAKNG